MKIHLGGDDDFFTFGVFLEKFTGKRFGKTVGIEIGSVKKIDSGFDCTANERTDAALSRTHGRHFGEP